MPTCAVETTFPSIECRLAELAPQIVVSPGNAKFEVKLQNLLAKTDALVVHAQVLVGDGRPDRAKRALSQAVTRLGRFTRAVGTKKGQKVIEVALREQLVAEAEAIRGDTRLLGQSL